VEPGPPRALCVVVDSWPGAMNRGKGRTISVVPVGGGRLQLPGPGLIQRRKPTIRHRSCACLFLWASHRRLRDSDAAVHRRSGWGAAPSPASSRIICASPGPGVILNLARTPSGRCLRASNLSWGPSLIIPIAVIMVLAPRPAACVNCDQAGPHCPLTCVLRTGCFRSWGGASHWHPPALGDRRGAARSTSGWWRAGSGSDRSSEPGCFHGPELGREARGVGGRRAMVFSAEGRGAARPAEAPSADAGRPRSHG